MRKALRILVVEDNALFRALIDRVLDWAGYQAPDFAADADQALTAIRQADPPFDLMVLDISLGNHCGIELLKTIRMQHTHRTLPTVVSTTRRSRAAMDELISAGIHGFVAKPIVPNRLIDAIEHAATGGPTLDRITLPAMF